MGILEKFKGKARGAGGRARRYASSFRDLYRKRGITQQSAGGGTEAKKEGGQQWVKTKLTECPNKECGAKFDTEHYGKKCPHCGTSVGLFAGFGRKIKGLRKKKKEEAPEKEDKPEKEGEDKPEKEEEKKKKSKLSISGGGSWGSAIVGGIMTFVGFFFALPMAFTIPFAILLILGIISFFLPERIKKGFMYVIILAFLGSWAFLYWTGGFEVITSHTAIRPFMDQIEGTFYEIKDNVVTAYETSKCYTKINPDLVDACLEKLEEKKEEQVRKIGKNENLRLTYGQRVGGKTFENLKPHVDRRYNYYFMLKNENSEEYEIEVKNITVVASGDETEPEEPEEQPGGVRRRRPYNIKPQEELPVRVEWTIVGDNPNPLPECTSSIEFLINITSVQKSGGGSAKHGLVPREEGYINFLHFFDPKIETNPGPLDIYVFTDPYAVNVEWYTAEGFVVIIKIKNKVEGTAFLDNITLVQTFDTPWKYFYLSSECYDEEGKEFTLDDSTRYTEGECSEDEYPANCYTFDFVDVYGYKLNLTKDETKEIICAAYFQDPDINNLVGTYTDLISVFTPSYEFLQEFKETKRAECGSTMSTGFQCPKLGNTACPGSSDTCCCLCWNEAIDAGLNTNLGEGSGFGCDDTNCPPRRASERPLPPESCMCP